MKSYLWEQARNIEDVLDERDDEPDASCWKRVPGLYREHEIGALLIGEPLNDWRVVNGHPLDGAMVYEVWWRAGEFVSAAELDAEHARWQRRIEEVVARLAGCPIPVSVGAESGDPLDDAVAMIEWLHRDGRDHDAAVCSAEFAGGPWCNLPAGHGGAHENR